MNKLTPMTALMALIAAAAFLAKVKYGFGTFGFHVGN
jgi:hypothetical protein